MFPRDTEFPQFQVDRFSCWNIKKKKIQFREKHLSEFHKMLRSFFSIAGNRV